MCLRTRLKERPSRICVSHCLCLRAYTHPFSPRSQYHFQYMNIVYATVYSVILIIGVSVTHLTRVTGIGVPLGYAMYGGLGFAGAIYLTYQCLQTVVAKNMCTWLSLVALYLFMLNGFASLALATYLRDPTSLHGLDDRNHQNHVGRYIDLLYFAVVTSSTVGYGDVTAGDAWGRLVVAGYIVLSYILQMLVVTFVVQNCLTL